MQSENDIKELILAAKNGDSKAFGQIYDLYFERIYRYVQSMLKESAESEDVTAEIFIKVMGALPEYRESGYFSAWLFRIARNGTFNHIKKTKRRKETTLFENNANLSNPVEEVEEKELIEKMAQAMKNLTDLQREVLTLRFGEDFSIKETADVMRRSIPAVKFLQVSALRALRRQFAADKDNGVP